jgi:outer membrane protein assembly factor BamB
VRWQRLPSLLLLIAVVPVLAEAAGPARAGSQTDFCPVPPPLRGVHGSVVSSLGAADAGGVYVAASIQVVSCDARGDVYLSSQDATLVALDPTTGSERWRFATGAHRLTPPVVADGLAYSFDDMGTLYAVDATTGAERWRVETGMAFAAPVVAGGVVYAAGGGHLYALDAASGTERWRRSFVPPASRLAEEQGTVYAGCCSDDWTAWHLAALDAATGDERWSLRLETAGNCAVAGPAVAEGVAYIVRMTGEGARSDGYLAALDAATGAERWRWAFDPGGLAVTPVVSADTVYATGLATLHAVDAAGGTERWVFSIVWRMVGLTSAVAADGTVFVHADAGDQAALYAIDEATGTERWRFPTHAPQTLSEQSRALVVVAEGVAYVGGGGTVYAVDAASGAERWRSGLVLALPAGTPEGDASPAAGA